VLLVFDRVGPRNPGTVVARPAEPTRRRWPGVARDGSRLYGGKLPIVVTGMKQLKEHGPAGRHPDRRFRCGQPGRLARLTGQVRPPDQRGHPRGGPHLGCPRPR
jgi:hypothetical protein